MGGDRGAGDRIGTTASILRALAAMAPEQRAAQHDPRAHVDQRLVLDLLGWRQTEAFQCAFGGDAVAAAFALRRALDAPSS